MTAEISSNIQRRRLFILCHQANKSKGHIIHMYPCISVWLVGERVLRAKNIVITQTEDKAND